MNKHPYARAMPAETDIPRPEEDELNREKVLIVTMDRVERRSQGPATGGSSTGEHNCERSVCNQSGGFEI
jgi:hypothetical protein